MFPALDRFNANTGNRLQQPTGEQRVALMDHGPLAFQNSIQAGLPDAANKEVHIALITVIAAAARDLVREVGERALDPTIAPIPILFCPR